MQTHKIATAPTNQLPVCLSAHHRCVSVQVIQALVFPPLCVAAYSSAPLLGFYPCFAQVKMTVKGEWSFSSSFALLFLLALPLACAGMYNNTSLLPCH